MLAHFSVQAENEIHSGVTDFTIFTDCTRNKKELESAAGFQPRNFFKPLLASLS